MHGDSTEALLPYSFRALLHDTTDAQPLDLSGTYNNLKVELCVSYYLYFCPWHRFASFQPWND